MVNSSRGMRMSILSELQKAMRETGANTAHHGYGYCVGDIFTIMVCSMLCSLQTLDDIHEWSQSGPARAFLKEEFQIDRVPCCAQFYNILACVNPEKFNQSFIKWMQTVLQSGVSGKTVATNGKTIC